MMLDKTRRKVYFNKTTATIWIIAGILAFPLGWIHAIWFVVIASVYANVKADWSTAEAADNRDLKEQLDRIEKRQERILQLLEEL